VRASSRSTTSQRLESCAKKLSPKRVDRALHEQGDQIGRIFAYWAVALHWEVFLKIDGVAQMHICATFFNCSSYVLFFAKNRLSYTLADFFPQTYQVTLYIRLVPRTYLCKQMSVRRS
jgi:hypothetical protein